MRSDGDPLVIRVPEPPLTLTRTRGCERAVCQIRICLISTRDQIVVAIDGAIDIRAIVH